MIFCWHFIPNGLHNAEWKNNWIFFIISVGGSLPLSMVGLTIIINTSDIHIYVYYVLLNKLLCNNGLNVDRKKIENIAVLIETCNILGIQALMLTESQEKGKSHSDVDKVLYSNHIQFILWKIDNIILSESCTIFSF